MLNKNINKNCFFALIIFCSLVLSSCARHVPDTNGKNNYALTSITLQDIITGNKCVKSGASTVKKGKTVNIDVKKFSGVDTLHKFQLNGNSLDLSLSAQVNSGNLKILLCDEHTILKEFLVNKGTQSVKIPPMSDTLYLKVGGESANYSLSFEYNVNMSQGIMI